MAILNTTDEARLNLLRELSGKESFSDSESKIFAVKKFEDDIGASFKKNIIYIVATIFIFSVLFLWIGLWWLADKEYELIKNKIIVTGTDKVISEKVVLALITGTVLQVSVSFGLVVKYLFSKNIETSSKTSQDIS